MKSFRYENLPDFRIVTEKQIREQIAGGLMSKDWTDRAEEVLAIKIGESYSMPGGAKFTRVADDTEPVTSIICGGRGRGRAKQCTFCQTPTKDGRLCDGEPVKRGQSCDAFMCPKCATKIGPNVDLCPPCAKRQRPESR